MGARVCFGYFPRRNEFYDAYCSRNEMNACPVSKRVNYAISGEEFVSTIVDDESEEVAMIWRVIQRVEMFREELMVSPVEN